MQPLDVVDLPAVVAYVLRKRSRQVVVGTVQEPLVAAKTVDALEEEWDRNVDEIAMKAAVYGISGPFPPSGFKAYFSFDRHSGKLRVTFSTEPARIWMERDPDGVRKVIECIKAFEAHSWGNQAMSITLLMVRQAIDTRWPWILFQPCLVDATNP